MLLMTFDKLLLFNWIFDRNLVPESTPKNLVDFLPRALHLNHLKEIEQELGGILLHPTIDRFPIEIDAFDKILRIDKILYRKTQ